MMALGPIAAAQWRMIHFGIPRFGQIHTKGRRYPHQILDPSMKGGFQYPPLNLTHRAPLILHRHMTYLTVALLPNRCGQKVDADQSYMPYHTVKYMQPSGGWSISRHEGSVLSTSITSVTSKKDWFQYQPLNVAQRALLSE